MDKHALEHSVLDVLTGACGLLDAMHFSEHGGYQLLPSNRDVTAAEVELLEMSGRESRLRDALPRCGTTTTTCSSTARRRCPC